MIADELARMLAHLVAVMIVLAIGLVLAVVVLTVAVAVFHPDLRAVGGGLVVGLLVLAVIVDGGYSHSHWHHHD